MKPCAYCGDDIAVHGTTLEAELLIEDKTYGLNPSFCSWPHAAAWFNQVPPDISAWHQVKKGNPDGGLLTWVILLVLIILLLGTVITLMATLR